MGSSSTRVDSNDFFVIFTEDCLDTMTRKSTIVPRSSPIYTSLRMNNFKEIEYTSSLSKLNGGMIIFKSVDGPNPLLHRVRTGCVLDPMSKRKILKSAKSEGYQFGKVTKLLTSRDVESCRDMYEKY